MSRHKRTSHTITDFYNHYISEIEPNTVYDVDRQVYRSIVEDYFKHLRDEVLLNSKTISLHGIGSLCVIKHQPKNYNSKSLRVDFKATKEFGKTIYHLNEHSDGFKFRFYWSKTKYPLINKTRYELIATRHNKRLLAKIIKERITDYIEI